MSTYLDIAISVGLIWVIFSFWRYQPSERVSGEFNSSDILHAIRKQRDRTK